MNVGPGMAPPFTGVAGFPPLPPGAPPPGVTPPGPIHPASPHINTPPPIPPWRNPPGPDDASWGAFDRKDGASIDISPRVVLKSSGAKPPFFCVAPMAGSVAIFKELVSEMDALKLDRPVHGLQSRGLDGKEDPLETIEETAAFHIDSIRSVQPEGPYAVGGCASGGWVAFEITRQLAQQGEAASPLAIMGAGPPPSLANPAPHQWIDFYARMMEDYQTLLRTSFRTEAQRLAEKAAPRSSRSPRPGPDARRRAADAAGRAALRYTPRPIPGSIHLFAGGDPQKGAGVDPAPGWRMLCVGRVHVHPVSDRWSTMFQRPRVRALAEKLTACLNQAQQKGEKCRS